MFVGRLYTMHFYCWFPSPLTAECRLSSWSPPSHPHLLGWCSRAASSTVGTAPAVQHNQQSVNNTWIFLWKCEWSSCNDNIRLLSSRQPTIFHFTLLKQDSHSTASSVCRSWTSSALCRYVKACMRTCRRASQHSQAIPSVAITDKSLTFWTINNWIVVSKLCSSSK